MPPRCSHWRSDTPPTGARPLRAPSSRQPSQSPAYGQAARRPECERDERPHLLGREIRTLNDGRCASYGDSRASPRESSPRAPTDQQVPALSIARPANQVSRYKPISRLVAASRNSGRGSSGLELADSSDPGGRTLTDFGRAASNSGNHGVGAGTPDLQANRTPATTHEGVIQQARLAAPGSAGSTVVRPICAGLGCLTGRVSATTACSTTCSAELSASGGKERTTRRQLQGSDG